MGRSRWDFPVLFRILAYQLQADRLGDLGADTLGVCLTGSRRGLARRPTGLWLTSTDPEPS
jgi:hypothetical protein